MDYYRRICAKWLAACAGAMYKSLLVCLCVSYVTGEDINVGLPVKQCAPEIKPDCEEDWTLSMSCELHPLDDPFHQRKISILYHGVHLKSCVPQESYADSLQALNRSVKTELLQTDLPDQLPYRSFSCLPQTLKKLVLSATNFLVLKPGALVGLRVSSLELERVQADRVPPGLQELKLAHRGSSPLPLGALNVPILKIEETNFTSLHGTASGLKRLQVSAPMVKLPSSLELEILELYNMREELPEDLLDTATRLTTFIAEGCSFTNIPKDFFFLCVRLETIRLRDNMLTSFEIPTGWAFTMKTRLKTLNLKGNRLTAQSIRTLGNATGLEVLDLSRNPLGDLCTTAGNSILEPLKNLTRLNLSETRLTHVCPDWMHGMTHLQSLDLAKNDIRNITCADLRMQRDLPANSSAAEVNLEINPLSFVYCSSFDHEATVLSKPVVQKVQVTHNVLFPCSCDTYWLSRVVRERSAAVDFKVFLEKACHKDWGLRCRARTVCPPGVKQRCELHAYAYNQDLYYIHDESFALYYDEGNYYTAFCNVANLDSIAWPVFPHKVTFNTVTLYGCRPAATFFNYHSASYAEALSLFNITIGENLYLYNLPARTKFDYHSLLDMPKLKLLHIEAAEVIKLENDTLANVSPISSLHLVRANTEEVPPNLIYLNMTECNLTMLPVGAGLAKKINIVEKSVNLKSLSGNATRLEKLSVTAPVVSLPTAPALQVLELTGAEPQAGFVSEYPQLHTLRLRRLRKLQLPAQFLRGATPLRHFELTQNSFYTLPADLFSFSTELETIDLSNNRLGSLPKTLFEGLAKLTSLNLENNQLNLLTLPDFTPLESLEEIIFKGNINHSIEN